MDLAEAFERHDDEYLKFDRIESPRSKRPDLHALMLLDELVPDTDDILCAAEHDEVWLGIDCEKLSAVITDEQVRDLHRCGVRYDADIGSLCMFV